MGTQTCVHTHAQTQRERERERERANLKVMVILGCSYSFVKIFFAHKAPWTHSVWTDIYFYKLFLSVVSNWLGRRHDAFVSASFLKYIDSVLDAVKYSSFSSSHVITQDYIFYQRIINGTNYKTHVLLNQNPWIKMKPGA